jgi:hypothetical protein
MLKYLSLSSIVSAVAAAVLLSDTANAVTFNGFDQNNGVGNPPPRLTTATSPNSQAAFANFSSNLNGATVTTESFENIPTTTFIDGLSTSISGTTATFSYTKKSDGSSANGGATTQIQQADASGNTNSGTYPTDGVRGISINSSNNFSISFSNPLGAFGYFGTDLGDNSNILTMKFFNGATEVNSTLIPVNANSFNSSEFFFGFISDNPTQYFDRVAFVSSISSNGDAIGIDQIKVGTPAQVTTAVPEPSSLLGTLLVGGSVMLVKRRSRRTKLLLQSPVDNGEITVEQ